MAEGDPNLHVEAVVAAQAQAQALANRFVQENQQISLQYPGGAGLEHTEKAYDEDVGNKRKYEPGIDGVENGSEGPLRKKFYSGPDDCANLTPVSMARWQCAAMWVVLAPG